MDNKTHATPPWRELKLNFTKNKKHCQPFENIHFLKEFLLVGCHISSSGK
jgi:hypothetical protein